MPNRRRPKSSVPLKRRSRTDAASETAQRNLLAGNLTAASAWAHAVVAGNPPADHPADYWLAARIFAACRNLRGIEQAVAKLLADFPEQSGSSRLGLACCLAEAGATDEAAATFRQLLAQGNPTGVEWTAFAAALEAGGDPARATRVLEERIQQNPRDRDAGLWLARLWIDAGRFAEGAALLRSILEDSALDDYQSTRGWYNLGVALERDSPEAAAQAYAETIRRDNRHTRARHNLAALMIRNGRHEEAARLLEESLRLVPEHHEFRYLLARCHHFTGQLDAAIALLQLLVNTVSTHEAGWELLARCQHEQAQPDKAVETCRRWLRNCPQSESAKHLLAAFSGESIPQRASAGHVAATFDRFAGSFDETLRHLQYRGPELFEALLRDHLGPPMAALDILDAGCGTGLIGRVLRPWARRLEGIDLSGQMLQRARATGLYDRLDQEELTAWLERHSTTWDLIVSADTLNYFGNLEPVLRGAFGALRPGGWLMFTVEEGPLDGDTWYLLPHGRYAHAPGYLMEQLGELGVPGGKMRRAELRRESGRPVYSLIVAVQRPASAD